MPGKPGRHVRRRGQRGAGRAEASPAAVACSSISAAVTCCWRDPGPGFASPLQPQAIPSLGRRVQGLGRVGAPSAGPLLSSGSNFGLLRSPSRGASPNP